MVLKPGGNMSLTSCLYMEADSILLMLLVEGLFDRPFVMPRFDFTGVDGSDCL